MCAGVALGLVYVVYRRRVNKIRHETALHIQAIEAELKALRSQMNPHFTFNSLNAIQNLILDEQNDLAAGYLTKMARLMRLILINSEKNLISLKDETELLHLYLEMESLRFDQSFTYEIRYKGEPDPATVMIPTMVFQPFAENAIWHGLMNKKGRKNLVIIFTVLPETRQIIGRVTDNGVGRKTGEKNSTFQKHQSKGIALIQQRLTYVEHQTGQACRLDITDMLDEHGQAAGTAIQVTLPLIIEKKFIQQPIR